MEALQEPRRFLNQLHSPHVHAENFTKSRLPSSYPFQDECINEEDTPNSHLKNVLINKIQDNVLHHPPSSPARRIERVKTPQESPSSSKQLHNSTHLIDRDADTVSLSKNQSEMLQSSYCHSTNGLVQIPLSSHHISEQKSAPCPAESSINVDR